MSNDQVVIKITKSLDFKFPYHPTSKRHGNFIEANHGKRFNAERANMNYYRITSGSGTGILVHIYDAAETVYEADVDIVELESIPVDLTKDELIAELRAALSWEVAKNARNPAMQAFLEIERTPTHINPLGIHDTRYKYLF